MPMSEQQRQQPASRARELLERARIIPSFASFHSEMVGPLTAFGVDGNWRAIDYVDALLERLGFEHDGSNWYDGWEHPVSGVYVAIQRSTMKVADSPEAPPLVHLLVMDEDGSHKYQFDLSTDAKRLYDLLLTAAVPALAAA